MLTLALANWIIGLLVVLFLFLCILMILTVLIQRPTGGGLSGAFGSAAGSGQTAFGAKTGDALTIATIAMFVIYIVTAVGLNFALRPQTQAPVTPVAVPAGTGGAEDGTDSSGADDALTPGALDGAAPDEGASDEPSAENEPPAPAGDEPPADEPPAPDSGDETPPADDGTGSGDETDGG